LDESAGLPEEEEKDGILCV
jgi:hypothetical protein